MNSLHELIKCQLTPAFPSLVKIDLSPQWKMLGFDSTNPSRKSSYSMVPKLGLSRLTRMSAKYLLRIRCLRSVLDCYIRIVSSLNTEADTAVQRTVEHLGSLRYMPAARRLLRRDLHLSILTNRGIAIKGNHPSK